MTFAFILTAILLAIAVGIRRLIPLLGVLFIPASVIAGIVGFAAIQIATFAFESDQMIELSSEWKSWPGMLIAVVFAGMLLGRPSSSASDSIIRAGRQGLMVWIIVLGQTAIGLLATWLIIQPMFGVPSAFGMLIETGFAGGHGTAAAMGEVFASEQVELDAGLDLGVLMATVGLVYGIVSGVFWVNVGIRRGWTRKEASGSTASSKTQSTEPIEKSSIGTAVVKPDLIDPLLLQVIWLTLAMAVGWCLQWSVGSLAGLIEHFFLSGSPDSNLTDRTSASAIVGSFPLFIYTLFGGWAVRLGLTKIGSGNLIDSMTVNRITSSAMDVLIVAAIASLNVTVVSGQLSGLVVLVLAAILWTAFCLAWLSPRILPTEHWFELGLINYGMSTGTTATGFVLLKLVDPELQSGAAEDYALAAPLSSPFIGGGMITIGLPILILPLVPLPAVIAVLVAIIIGLIVTGIKVARR
ncbi:hypothetical protein LF1_30620 [Rubripirellula obstinata]|uniref:Sodium/glutamate symporter n=1 Tax=Rubripirellula obstinata TaxID=406547 RepID=A0A5B1CJR4_9BACT|nr:hypothetical protein [Rubripirellula obstinata]KAA1260522.1 hypothetical protein LF1_30620 [Rubripirellula obstinata]